MILEIKVTGVGLDCDRMVCCADIDKKTAREYLSLMDALSSIKQKIN